MIKLAGQTEIVVCDHCGRTCEEEVVAVTHYHAGHEDEATTKHFCSVVCQEENAGVADRITVGIERGTRKEINTIHKFVCPKCVERLKRFL